MPLDVGCSAKNQLSLEKALKQELWRLCVHRHCVDDRRCLHGIASANGTGLVSYFDRSLPRGLRVELFSSHVDR